MNAQQTIVMIQILIVLCTISFLAWINALISYFLDYCFQPHSIFKKWLPWLAEAVISEEDWQEVQALDNNLKADEYQNRAMSYFFYKILGGCIVCTNAWVSFITFGLIIYFLGFPWYYGIAYTVSSSYFIRRIINS